MRRQPAISVQQLGFTFVLQNGWPSAPTRALSTSRSWLARPRSIAALDCLIARSKTTGPRYQRIENGRAGVAILPVRVSGRHRPSVALLGIRDRTMVELLMSYLKPEDVRRPTDRERPREVLHDGGEGGRSAAKGQWGKGGRLTKVLAVRWNIRKGTEIGDTPSRGLLTRCVVPCELERPVREAVARSSGARSGS